ncbi:MAG: hypothetical protein ABFC96_06430 [Thermoguttaceae bacterium]
MTNIKMLWRLFDVVDTITSELGRGDEERKDLLDNFFFRFLTVCDGLEGPEGCRGIALVATEDLPSDVEEINDGFLHELWAERHDGED